MLRGSGLEASLSVLTTSTWFAVQRVYGAGFGVGGSEFGVWGFGLEAFISVFTTSTVVRENGYRQHV